MKTDEFAFGPFRLDRGNALLRRGVDRVALTPKPFEVLCYFVERPGQLVTKDELMTAIWPDLHVSEFEVLPWPSTHCVAFWGTIGRRQPISRR